MLEVSIFQWYTLRPQTVRGILLWWGRIYESHNVPKENQISQIKHILKIFHQSTLWTWIWANLKEIKKTKQMRDLVITPYHGYCKITWWYHQTKAWNKHIRHLQKCLSHSIKWKEKGYMRPTKVASYITDGPQHRRTQENGHFNQRTPM